MYVEACGSVIQFLKSRSSRFIRCSFGENGKNGKFPGNYWSFVVLYKQFWPRDSDFTNERISTTWQLLFYTSGTKNAQLLGFLAIPRHARHDFCLLSILPIPLLKKKKQSFEAVAQRCSVKKLFFEISQNRRENTFARASFLIKLQATGIFIRILRNFVETFSYRTPLVAASECFLTLKKHVLGIQMACNQKFSPKPAKGGLTVLATKPTSWVQTHFYRSIQAPAKFKSGMSWFRRKKIL